MILNLKEETKLIDSSDVFKEKLMTIALYNEFYNGSLNNADDFLKDQYGAFMKKTFELVATGLIMQDKNNINAKQFMKPYLRLLKKHPFSDMSQPKNMINLFEKKLDAFIESCEYVNRIDKFNNISLSGKVNIMSQFREYLNETFLKVYDIYCEEKSEEIRQNILDVLSIKIEEYLNHCSKFGYSEKEMADNIKPAMVIATKNYFINLLKNNNYSIDEINEDINEFKGLERKIMTMGAIYHIAGYSDDIAPKDAKTKEMCEVFGVSRLKLKSAAFSMGIRYLKIAKKEMNHEIKNSDTPTKRRK